MEKTYKEYIKELYPEMTDIEFDVFFEEQQAIRDKLEEEVFRETPLQKYMNEVSRIINQREEDDCPF